MKIASKIIAYVSLGIFMLLGLYYLIGAVVSMNTAFQTGYVESILMVFIQLGVGVATIVLAILALVKCIKNEQLYFKSGCFMMLVYYGVLIITYILTIILYLRNSVNVEGGVYYFLVVAIGAFVVTLIAIIKKTNYILYFVALGLGALLYLSDIVVLFGNADTAMIGFVESLFLHILGGLVALKIFEVINLKKQELENKEEQEA